MYNSYSPYFKQIPHNHMHWKIQKCIFASYMMSLAYTLNFYPLQSNYLAMGNGNFQPYTSN